MIDFSATSFNANIADKLAGMSSRVKKNVTDITRIFALKIWNGARDKCPVVTGNLRGSIGWVMLDDFSALVYSNVEYAEVQEYSEDFSHFDRVYDIKGMQMKQKNENAQWGFFRKSLAEVIPEYKTALGEALAGGMK